MLASFDVVVACDLNRGIGKNSQLPWKIPGDLKFFKELTCAVSLPGRRNAVIMGRKTWESIPEKRRPLAERINVVVTRDDGYQLPDGVVRASSLDRALEALQEFQVEKCFVIGGGEIYRLALQHPRLSLVHITQVRSVFDCDTFFPEYEKEFALVESSDLQQDNGIEYAFQTYRRVHPQHRP